MTLPPESFTLVNGARFDASASDVSFLNRGFQYGDGLFETLRVVNGQLPLLKWHLERLSAGCDRLGISLADEFSQWLRAFQGLLAADSQGIAKIYWFRAEAGPGNYIQNRRAGICVMCFEPAPLPPNVWLQPVVQLKTVALRLSRNPNLAGIKHLSRAEYCMAIKNFDCSGSREALLLDTQHNVIETPHHNIVAVSGKTLITPDVTEVGVAGVMRKLVAHLTTQLPDMVWQVRCIKLEELLRCSEIFLTNAVRGIVPVARCEDKNMVSIGPVTRRVAQLVSEYAREK